MNRGCGATASFFLREMEKNTIKSKWKNGVYSFSWKKKFLYIFSYNAIKAPRF